MRSPVRWAGGKGALLGELFSRIHRPAGRGRYFEPFAGGAALFFALAPGRAVLGDQNEDLIAAYRALATSAEDVALRLDDLERQSRADPRAHYLDTRAQWNARTRGGGVPRRHFWTPAERAAAFLYLNKTCFNGLWRVNRAGDFNVPYGRPCPGLDEDALERVGEQLERAELRVGDYRHTCHDAGRGDVVYLDPPYLGDGFTAYTSGGFGPAEHRELAAHAVALRERGAVVWQSNSDTPLARELAEAGGARSIDELECAGSVSGRASGRRRRREILIRW